MKPKPAIFSLLTLGLGTLTLCAQNFVTLDPLGSGTGQGGAPFAGLTLEGSVLFGMTTTGGANGQGNVFKVNTDGSGLVDIYDFTGNPNQSTSEGALVLSGSTLYGTVQAGGSAGFGTLFAVNTDGTGYTNLHVFSSTFNGTNTDGAYPSAGLILSSNILYGTAQAGGRTGNGTVFAINTDGTGFTNLFSFAGTNGSQPYGTPVLAGNLLYGTTMNGGAANSGAVFSLTTDGKTLSLLHSFSTTNGTMLMAGLLLSGGILYGTAYSGGADFDGTVFSLGINGSNFTVLHNFTNGSGDGAYPAAGLIMSGNLLFGTTSAGGSRVNRQGTVFSVSTNGTNFNLLYSFTGGSDGGDPESAMLLSGPNLYCTTSGGGDANGDGTIFDLQLTGIVFAQQPISQTNLSVNASPSFSYGGFSLTPGAPGTLPTQWRLNGVNIPGQTTYTLMFTNVQATNGGLVTTDVADGLYAVNSTTAEFRVPTSLFVTNNDYFTNRYALAQASSGVLDSSNTNATRETGEPVILAGTSGGKSIWFKWKPPSSGIAVFTTAGSAFDTIMGVYTGTNIATLVREPSAISDDDSGGYLTSKVSFNAVSGQEYEIVVDGHSGASGSVVLSWQTIVGAGQIPVILSAPPPLTVTSNGGSVTLVCQTSTGVPMWYLNGVRTSTTGATNLISSVTSSSVGSWVAQIPSPVGNVVTQPSLIEISTLEDGTTDTNSAALNKFLNTVSTTFVQTSLPVLRRQDGGGDTRGYSVSQVFSTVGAQGEPGEPNIAGQIGGSPVWYKYVAPTNGALVVSTAGSSFNTLLGVFTGPGDSFATLTSLGQAYTSNRVLNGQPQISVTNVPAGQTNYIVVDGYLAATGTVQLNIALGNAVSITTPPSSQYVVAGSNATFTVTAFGSTPLSYAWQHAGTNITGATNASLTINNAQSAATGTYTVIVSNPVSAATNSATLTLGTLPAITTQPASHTIHTNTTASLTVSAAGLPSLSYQWLFNGTNTGPNASTLSIPNFAATNQGSYWVVASNSLGTATSSNAILLLDSPFRVGSSSLTSGVFQLQLIGSVNSNYVLETSTNLQTWTKLATNNSSTGFINFTDTNAAKFGYRFYRAQTN